MQEVTQPSQKKLTYQVDEKGRLAVHGLRWYPIVLSVSEWKEILDQAEEIKSFVVANKEVLNYQE